MRVAKPRLLVLDGQGVVFDAPIKLFLERFAKDNRLDYVQVEKRWEAQYRQSAWTGAIDDAALWQQLAGKSVDVARTRLLLDRAYRPGPAAAHIARWSQTVPVWLLSNHRSDWIVPKLAQLGAGNAFERLLISDITGAVKPEPAAFGQLLTGEFAPAEILFVDDQRHNVEAARQHGLQAIHASPTKNWVTQIELALAT